MSDPTECHDIVEKFGIDMGGTLIKVFWREADGEKFRFFATSNIKEAVDFLNRHLSPIGTVVGTGGGFVHNLTHLNNVFGANRVFPIDEMQAVVEGFQRVSPQGSYPCLYVNIGSGVSIIRLDSDHTYLRVAGTAIGGTTMLGLGFLLTGENDYDSILNFAEKGTNDYLDLTVGDIYGKDYEGINLRSDVIASFFGKVIHNKREKYEKGDILYTLLCMICSCIVQTSIMTARLHCVSNIYYGGGFLRNDFVKKIMIKMHAMMSGKQIRGSTISSPHVECLGAIGSYYHNWKYG